MKSQIDYSISFADVCHAYINCKKRKNKTFNLVQFEQNLEDNLYDLYLDVINHTYVPSRFLYFILSKPKFREVWASSFRDRIIHHLIYNKISDFYYKRFIYDSYACIPGKGNLAASKRVEKYIRKINNQTRDILYLKLDIKNFFNTIDHNILKNILLKNIDQKSTLWYLIKTVIDHDPTKNFVYRGCETKISQVPNHKRLINAGLYRGLPIGNLTSQLFANVYLNELDQFCKNELKLKYYFRYVDDIVILSDSYSRSEFVKLYRLMQNKISILNVSFHENKILIQTTKYGLNFVGRILYPFHVSTRKSTLDGFYKSINSKNTQSINSYLGILKHTNSYEKITNAVKILTN